MLLSVLNVFIWCISASSSLQGKETVGYYCSGGDSDVVLMKPPVPMEGYEPHDAFKAGRDSKWSWLYNNTLTAQQIYNLEKLEGCKNVSKIEWSTWQSLNKYRASYKQPSIPLGFTMSVVSHLKIQNVLQGPGSTDNCAAHSWLGHAPSSGPLMFVNYSTCCYDINNYDTYPCMWYKPSEIFKDTTIPVGYEVAAYTSGNFTNQSGDYIIGMFTTDAAHNDVLLSQGSWAGYNWDGVGVGISDKYCFIWFTVGKTVYPNCPTNLSKRRMQASTQQ